MDADAERSYRVVETTAIDCNVRAKDTNSRRIEEALSVLLRYAKQHDYAGYSKFDALNSPLIEKFTSSSGVLRILCTQLVNRVALPIRPLAGVLKSRNPKGIANFIRSLALSYKIAPSPSLRSEIVSLCDWLVNHQANTVGNFPRKFSGACWGYNFPWQSPAFFAPRYYPNAIVTTFCGEAFLAAGLALKEQRFIDTAVDTVKYLLGDLPVMEESEETKCIGYVDANPRMKVININSVVAGFLAKLSTATSNVALLGDARKMLSWVAQTKTPYHAWHYTHPASVYVRDHDNYHTGGILDGFFDYLQVEKNSHFLQVYFNGLKFYEQHLFSSDGAPKWRSNKRFPHDIHGSAQGIISFSKAAIYNPSYLDRALVIANWALDNLLTPEGGFYYQKHRFFTWRLELMRWNNSWMALALAHLLTSKYSEHNL